MVVVSNRRAARYCQETALTVDRLGKGMLTWYRTHWHNVSFFSILRVLYCSQAHFLHLTRLSPCLPHGLMGVLVPVHVAW